MDIYAHIYCNYFTKETWTADSEVNLFNTVLLMFKFFMIVCYMLPKL